MTSNRTNTRFALRAFATVSMGTIALMLATGEAQAQNAQCRDPANNLVGTITPGSTDNVVCGDATVNGGSNVAIGNDANVEGPGGSTAFGSVAIGYSADALAGTSIAIGAVSEASGSSSMAVGFGSLASGRSRLRSASSRRRSAINRSRWARRASPTAPPRSASAATPAHRAPSRS
jgi:hypothetical protein